MKIIKNTQEFPIWHSLKSLFWNDVSVLFCGRDAHKKSNNSFHLANLKKYEGMDNRIF